MDVVAVPSAIDGRLAGDVDAVAGQTPDKCCTGRPAKTYSVTLSLVVVLEQLFYFALSHASIATEILTRANATRKGLYLLCI